MIALLISFATFSLLAVSCSFFDVRSWRDLRDCGSAEIPIPRATFLLFVGVPVASGLPTVSPCKAKMVWYLSSWDFRLMFSSSSSLILSDRPNDDDSQDG